MGRMATVAASFAVMPRHFVTETLAIALPVAMILNFVVTTVPEAVLTAGTVKDSAIVVPEIALSVEISMSFPFGEDAVF